MRVILSPTLDKEEAGAFSGIAWKIHENFACHPLKTSHALFIKAYEGERLIGFAPVIIAKKASSIKLLNKRFRTWLAWIPRQLTTKKTAIIDTSLMGYDNISPFYIDPAYPDLSDKIKEEFIKTLMQETYLDSIWIGGGDTFSPRLRRILGISNPFQIIPIASLNIESTRDLAEYSRSLTSKRRRNMNKDRKLFTGNGGTIQKLDFPLNLTYAKEAYQLLMNSHSRSSYYAPYQELQNSWNAFLTQEGFILAAFKDRAMIGFMSFYQADGTLLQTHGGFDYKHSLALKAYANLTHEAVDIAIKLNCSCISMGPLNNETKRRLCNQMDSVWVSLWCRSPVDRFAAKYLLIPNLESRYI